MLPDIRFRLVERERRASRRAVAWLLAIGFAFGACDRAPSAELIELEALEPVSGKAGAFHLVGRGFPSGRAGEVSLSGRLHAAGTPPVDVDLRVPCRTLGERVASFRLAGLPELSGRGPSHFQGSLRVAFEAEGGPAEVTGSLDDVRLRLQPRDLGARRAQLSISRRAADFHERAGLAELVADDDGVRVVALVEGSLATRVGLEVDDVIERFAGFAVDDPADLVPPAGVARVLAHVRRDARSLALTLPVSAEATAPASPRWGPVGVLAFLALFGVWLWPLGRDRASSPPWETRWAQTVAVLLCAVTVAGSQLAHGQLELFSVWLSPLLVALLREAWAYARGVRAGVVFAERVGRWFAASLALVGIGLLAGGAPGEARLLGAHALPWQWLLFRAPPALLACGVVVASLAAPRERSRGPVEATCDAWLAWAAATCLVALAAGGGELPGDLALAWGWDESALSLASRCLWLTKIAALAMGIGALRLPGSRGSLVWLGLTCPVLALAWLWLSPPPALVASFGVLAALVGALLLARAGLRRLRRAALLRNEELLPFL